MRVLAGKGHVRVLVDKARVRAADFADSVESAVFDNSMEVAGAVFVCAHAQLLRPYIWLRE